jgi:hypothetical protein
LPRKAFVIAGTGEAALTLFGLERRGFAMPLYSLKCWTRDGDGCDLQDPWFLESEWTIEANGDDDARSQALGFFGLDRDPTSKYASLDREGGRRVWLSERL